MRSSVDEIVNLATVAVLDAQRREKKDKNNIDIYSKMNKKDSRFWSLFFLILGFLIKN
jgi:hypothetical protein